MLKSSTVIIQIWLTLNISTSIYFDGPCRGCMSGGCLEHNRIVGSHYFWIPIGTAIDLNLLSQCSYNFRKLTPSARNHLNVKLLWGQLTGIECLAVLAACACIIVDVRDDEWFAATIECLRILRLPHPVLDDLLNVLVATWMDVGSLPSQAIVLLGAKVVQVVLDFALILRFLSLGFLRTIIVVYTIGCWLIRSCWSNPDYTL
jgi:hypothetical protein